MWSLLFLACLFFFDYHAPADWRLCPTPGFRPQTLLRSRCLYSLRVWAESVVSFVVPASGAHLALRHDSFFWSRIL
ncbi:hypothetical protein HDV63DRAFT_95549 [Trichoderma sp. SZMC 28014]